MNTPATAPGPGLNVLYGGTFDPVHLGHLAVARHARDALDATVALMPARDPPHRGATRADARQRAAMLDLAIQGEPRLRVDRRELHREGPSYTVDTLRALREEVGANAPWAILVGGDSLRTLDSWHQWRALFDLAHVVVAERAAIDGRDALPPAVAEEIRMRRSDDPRALHASAAGRILLLGQPLWPQSATDIRHRIASGAPWRDQVPPAVAGYITRHGLYA